MPESIARKLSRFISRRKQGTIGKYTGSKRQKNLIRFYDFVIVRTYGYRFIEFELTNICNARCIFCPYPGMLKSGKKFMHMQASTLESVYAQLDNFPGSLVSFTPTTGDTLLHPEWNQSIGRVLNHPSVSQATFYTNAIELDSDNCEKLIRLIKNDKAGKLSQLFFSVGGIDKDTYETLYQVDRFDRVKNNINQLLALLKTNGLCTGIHIHIKLLKSQTADLNKAMELYNPGDYPFVYLSASAQYESNDGLQRQPSITYTPSPGPLKTKACAYLLKTRFAADGGIWADGCVLSELPGDSTLKLGNSTDTIQTIEKARALIINNWEISGEIPLPCKGCTIYKARA